MLSHLDNITFKKNISLNLDSNIYNVTNFDFYQSILNECKKHILNKEIKFDNILTKQKKKDDENIISTNFIVNNLLNILNSKNVKDNVYLQKNTNVKIQKKKIKRDIKLKSCIDFKNKEQSSIEKNEKKHKKFENYAILKNSKHIKNKYFLFYNYNNTNSPNKSFNKYTLNTINNLNIIKNKKNLIKDNKNFILFKNHLNNISNSIFSKNTHKNINSIFEPNSFEKTDNNNFKLNQKLKYVFNSNCKENIQWKKAISQQILLSISNKKNEAEIHLKPESLGSIYIKINMFNDQAKLKFIADHIEIKNYLNNCVPFLRNALIKNGIFLKQVNISTSLNSKNKNLFILKYKPKISHVIKKFYKNLTQKKFFDTYI
ncbi:flagellar hook-length control protein FliK [Buchnera aphidicola (Aphis aurantii)]|uniref:flagellar hook-length control protein FliK n=1 Tax=Buchnera aphidicola TaxID=9 RepID=UPI0031B6B33A